MLARSEMPQRLRHAGDDLHRMLRDAKRKLVNALAQLRRQLFDTQTLKGFAKRIGEAVKTVAMRLNRLALHVIETLADLLRREFAVVEEGDDIGNRTLEVD